MRRDALSKKNLSILIRRAGSAALALLLLLSLISCPVLADEPPETSLEGAVSTEASSESSETTEADTTESGTDTTEAESTEEPTEPSGSAEETTPEETTPETTPEETTPEETTPEETTPEETTEEPWVIPSTPYTIPYRSFPAESINAPVKLAMTTTVKSSLELRTGPAKTYPQLAWVRRGVVLEVIGEKNGWYRVSTGYVVDGREVVGYISGNYSRAQTINPGPDSYSEYLSFLGFPETYHAKLTALHQQYPNWVFVANQTGENWATAALKESNRKDDYPGISLIHPEQKSSWKSKDFYNYETSTYEKFDGDWNAASDELVAYFLDPRNFLNSTDIFQFLNQGYESYQTVDAVKRIVSGTFLAASSVTDVDGTVFTYPAKLVQYGKEIGISPLYLAAVIKQEIGYADNPSINGRSAKYPGYYNYYNIYAVTTATESANDHGLWFASGSGSGQTSYGRPWNTRLKALRGGALYLYKNYVEVGQHTLYFKKFNMSCNAQYGHFRHQFMTNVMGSYSEGRHLANGYNTQLRQLPLVFDIPVYSNMPAEPCPCPTGDGCINNRLKSITVGSYELFPTFDKDTLYYNIIITGNAPATVTLSAKAYNSTAKIEGTGTIVLQNGTTDYPITVTAQNGDVRVYTVSIYCESGVATGLNPTYKIISGNRITGLSFGTKTDAFITNMGLGAGMTASLFTANGSAKQSGTVMMNGDTVKIFDGEEKLIFQGAVLLFGDVNGDGNLRMSDMIKVRNHILETGALTGINLAAADCNHDGNIRMSDMIKIRNEILGTGTIVQTGN